MRQSLLREFDTIYLLNLHGNSKKRERSPDGGSDENVFDIQQGVAIALFVKGGKVVAPASKDATVYYADLWGEREAKYAALDASDVGTTQWQQLSPVSPFYLFVPQNVDLRTEYERGWQVTDAFPTNAIGFQTHRDDVAVAYDEQRLLEQVKSYLQRSPDPTTWDRFLCRVNYRPFDTRFAYLAKEVADRPRLEVTAHLMSANIALNLMRQTKASEWKHALVSSHPAPAVYVEIKDGSSVFPLYRYAAAFGNSQRQTSLLDDEIGTSTNGRTPNVSPAFISDLEQRLSMQFVEDGKGDLGATFGPEDVYHYAYAIFHSPTYRTRYAVFLKIDFPRLPLTNDRELFAALVAKGAALVDLHLLRLSGSGGVGGAGGAAILTSPGKQGVSYPIQGTNVVEKVLYNLPLDEAPGYVVINGSQRFVGIEPDTWEMRIGGYQPLEKWLKDRKGRKLTTEDVQHYLRMIIALRETRRIMTEIDSIIPAWPLT